MTAVVFLVDDDDGSRDAMKRTLERVGYTLHAFPSAEEALERLREGEPVDAIVSDVRMPGMDGYEFLRAVRAENPKLPFLLVTAYADVEDAVSALQEGADDYMIKPVKMQELRQRVQLQLERRVLSDENRRLHQRLEKSFGFEGIVGRSQGMEELLDRLRVVAPTRSTVLIVGESGTGKELVANALHQNSPRVQGPFVAINCGAIPGEILESELFGHEKGAFTGAHQRRIGLIERASGGTLFLDEISELSPDLQVKLLRVLEERHIMRVGGASQIAVDFRLVVGGKRSFSAGPLLPPQGRHARDPAAAGTAGRHPCLRPALPRDHQPGVGPERARRPSCGPVGPHASVVAWKRARTAQPPRVHGALCQDR